MHATSLQRNGELVEEVVGYICPLIFLPWSARNPNFLSLNQQTSGTFYHPNKAKAFICQCFCY
ncbi:MAG: hypothetical protein O4805_21260 [Trichodesmium sp. St16_bin2-tuft]|nr:hypothetical protein [Trichodesmium sp. St16_bin2-tuft]MDE5121801.1 hypothetical protein [Trichodesmium sp. St19_bin1]